MNIIRFDNVFILSFFTNPKLYRKIPAKYKRVEEGSMIWKRCSGNPSPFKSLSEVTRFP